MEKKAGWLIKLQKAWSAQDGGPTGVDKRGPELHTSPRATQSGHQESDRAEPNLVKPQESQIPAYGTGRWAGLRKRNPSEGGASVQEAWRSRGGGARAGDRAKLPGDPRWARVQT